MMERDFDVAGGASGVGSEFLQPIESGGDDADSWDFEHAMQQPQFETGSQIEPSSEEAFDIANNSVDMSFFSGFNFRNTLRDATLSSSTTLPDLPWESPMWKCIFDDNYDPLSSLDPVRNLSGPVMPVMPRDGDELTQTLTAKKRSVAVDEKLPLFTVAVGHRRDVSWEEKREADFQRSLMKWTSIVLNWPGDWPFCQAIQESETVIQVCEQLSHFFVGKAPATLIKRANSMIFIMEQGHRLGYMFPYTESELYSLLKVLKDTGQTASRLKGIMEALTFCRYVFNIEQLSTLISSKRCYGVISSGPINRASQAAPLRVRDLVKLHDVLESSGEVWDRMMAGAALFCTYARARWSDFVHCGKLTLDKFENGSIAYIDADVEIHKTMHATARRFRFLNLTAPGLGVHGSDWGSQWIMTMESLGIDPFAASGGCLMPAPDAEGKPLTRALESDEAGCWLRLLIGEDKNRADSSRPISSHSLKATMLSMAAKRGYSHQDRLSLGHHTHPYQMADVYARDAAARDLRLLDALILEVRNGTFKPDESRAGRLDLSKRQRTHDDLDEDFHQLEIDIPLPETSVVPGPREPETKGKVEVVEEAQDDEDAGHVTTDSSDSETDDEDRALVQRQFLPPAIPDGYHCFQHHKSKLLHFMRVEDSRVLACGRMKSAAYRPPLVLRYDSAVCHACQRAVHRA